MIGAVFFFTHNKQAERLLSSDGCNKYYKDAKATQEITKAQTVTAKLPDDSKSPQTGDNSNLAFWIALLFISGGAVTVTTVYGRKKKRLTK